MVAEYFKVLHAQFIPQSPEYPADPAVYITLGLLEFLSSTPISGKPMNSDGVSTAFQIILEEIDLIVSEVNTQGAAFFRNNDYPKAEEALATGKKLQMFRTKLDSLKGEWISGLDEPTRQKVLVQQSAVVKSINSSSKSSKTILVVRFADGTVFFEPKASDTFAKAVKKIGIPKVAALKIKVNNFDLVSQQHSETYSQTEIDEFLIMTHSSTEAKRDKLLEISAALHVKLSVDIVPAKEA